MKAPFLAVTLAITVAAHDTGKKLPPPKAAPVIAKTRKLLDQAKKQLAAKGKYACCAKPSCDTCALKNGSCACAVNAGKGAGVCGECAGAWKAGRGALKGIDASNLKILESGKQALGQPQQPPAELNGAQEALLEAKRELAKEKRYSCCIRSGCTECAMEGECACGGNLGQGKGVCGTCVDGWHGGHGSFPGLTAQDVQLEPMDASSMAGMDAMMSTGVASSGWYGSGTAQMPRSSPLYMLHGTRGKWQGMLMGTGFLAATQQTGSRGGDKLFSANWLMPMASRRLGRGALTLRSMFSLEPATVTGKFYPLLFQTGETANGIPIVDGQHPHDFFMELGASYQLPLAESTALNIFAGVRGEPALGPMAFPHRLSASENPLAVLSHHYFDSTHIANNVVTFGLTHRQFTFEASGFNGTEPDEHRWGLETGRLNSWSGRVQWTPAPNWAVQASGGRIEGRESLHPDKNTWRTSVSAMYLRPNALGYWAATAAYGANLDFEGSGGHHQDLYQAVLLEGTLRRSANWYWMRFENTDKDSFIRYGRSRLLLEMEEERFARVAATTFGYERELPRPSPWLSAGLGGQLTVYRSPAEVRATYGSTPIGVQFFLRLRIAKDAR